MKSIRTLLPIFVKKIKLTLFDIEPTRLLRNMIVSSGVVLLVACGGGGGSSSASGKSVSIDPGAGTDSGSPPSPSPDPDPDPDPSLSFSASSTQVAVGDSVTLSWTGSNVDSCTATGDWSGARSTSGSQTITLQNDQTFGLSCSGDNGGVSRQVTVRIETDQVEPVRLTFNVNRSLIRINEQVTLTWDADNADTCVASGAWSGSQPVSGSYTSPALSNSATYTLRCENSAGTDIASTSVDVADLRLAWLAPDSNVDGTPLTDLAGFNVYWGRSPRSYVDSTRVGASVTEWDFGSFSSGTYYFSVTAVNAAGEESDHSNEVEEIVP